MLSAISVTHSLSAQKFYLDFHTGYAFRTNSQTLSLSNYSYVYSGSSYIENYDQVYVSLGKGVNFGASLGYMFNKNIGAEAGISYLIGGKFEDNESSTSFYTTTYNSVQSHSLSAKMFQFNPAIVLTPGFKTINPYAKFGVLITSGSIKYNTYTNNNGSSITDQTQKLSGGIGFGITASIGALYTLSKKTSLFAEITSINAAFAPNKGEITKYNYNGIDQLPTMTVSQKEIIFQNHYIQNNSPSTSEPSTALKQRYPMSSIGINIGLRINI